MQLDDCSVAYPDLIPLIRCCAMISTGCQSSRESFSRSECLDTRPSMALRLLTWRNCLFPCQVYRHWVETSHGDFIVPPSTRNTTYRQRSFAVAGPTWWNYFPLEICNSSSMQTFRSDLRYFYLERLTTSLPHNPTVCFSWTLADLWTFIIIYTVSDLPYVMRLGMLA